MYLKNSNLFIALNVKPNSRSDRVTSIDADSVGISISEPPRDGQANDGVLEFVAQILCAKKSNCMIVKGAKSHSKLV